MQMLNYRTEAMSAGWVASGNHTDPRGRPFGLSPLLPYPGALEAARRPGVSQRQAAKVLGVSQRTISNDVSKNCLEIEQKLLTPATATRQANEKKRKAVLEAMGWDESALRRRKLVQVHEAGHAVAIGGEAIIRLVIRRYRDGLYNFGGETRELRPRRIDADYAFIALAGIAAEAKFCRDEMFWPAPSANDCSFDGDRANLKRSLAFISAADADKAVARLNRALERHWNAILALMDALGDIWPDYEAESGPPGREYFREMPAETVREILRDAGLGA